MKRSALIHESLLYIPAVTAWLKQVSWKVFISHASYRGLQVKIQLFKNKTNSSTQQQWDQSCRSIFSLGYQTGNKVGSIFGPSRRCSNPTALLPGCRQSRQRRWAGSGVWGSKPLSQWIGRRHEGPSVKMLTRQHFFLSLKGCQSVI